FAAAAPTGATSASAAAAAIAAKCEPLDIRTFSVAFIRATGRTVAGHHGKGFVNQPARVRRCAARPAAVLRQGDDGPRTDVPDRRIDRARRLVVSLALTTSRLSVRARRTACPA